MLIVHLILAGLAVGAIARGSTSAASAAWVAALAGVAVLLGSPLAPALQAALPVLAFLTAALTLAAAADRAGLAERAADRVARLARGSTARLYAIVCVASALMTAVVSLDGAVVLMVPLLLALVRRHEAPLAPLLLGTVAVCNAASIAVPQGNPTNLVVIERLGIAPSDFLAQMLLPGLVAAAGLRGRRRPVRAPGARAALPRPAGRRRERPADARRAPHDRRARRSGALRVAGAARRRVSVLALRGRRRGDPDLPPRPPAAAPPSRSGWPCSSSACSS